MSAAEEIETIAARLREIAAALRADDADADALAREAADLVARAGAELERASDPEAGS